MRRQHHGNPLRPGLFVAGIVDRDAHGDAGIVDDDVERRRNARRSRLTTRSIAVAVGDVERPGLRVPAACRDLLRDRFGAVRRQIGHRDIGAFGREHARGGAAHAAGRTRDEHGQSLHRAAELLEFGHDVSPVMKAIDKVSADPKTDQTVQGRDGNERARFQRQAGPGGRRLQRHRQRHRAGVPRQGRAGRGLRHTRGGVGLFAGRWLASRRPRLFRLDVSDAAAIEKFNPSVRAARRAGAGAGRGDLSPRRVRDEGISHRARSQSDEPDGLRDDDFIRCCGRPRAR